MSRATYRISRDNRSFRQRLFEPPAVGKMSLMANLVAWAILLFWSLFVLFPIYWVVITAFKDAWTVNNGPFFIPFVDFQPTLKGWTAQFATDPYCDAYSIGRQLVLLLNNLFAFIVSPIVTIERMEPQICKVYLAYTNSFVISFGATALCIAVGSMAAYALARISYKPKFGNIVVFVLLALSAIVASNYFETSIRDRDRLDLDQPFRRGKRGDANERRGRRLHAFEESRTGLADDGAQLRLVADDEGRDLHDVAVGRAGRLQRMTEILHHLGRLRGEVAFAHNPSLLVDGHLTRDVDGACAGGSNDVGISGIVVQAAGAEMIELGHGLAPGVYGWKGA